MLFSKKFPFIRATGFQCIVFLTVLGVSGVSICWLTGLSIEYWQFGWTVLSLLLCWASGSFNSFLFRRRRNVK